MIDAPPNLPSCLGGVPLLRERPIAFGERWLYSAGFNVGPDLASTARVDCEFEDLARLAAGGARVAILTHQGSHRDGTARPLDFLVPYLERRLGLPVAYLADPLAPETTVALDRLEPGGIALLGNTRLLPGEEEGDPDLARRLARLGDAVAIGGFSKAHRAHASNAGLLRHLPGYAAESLVTELVELDPWVGADDRFSVAALGGLKREKIDPGLTGLAQTYDLLIPGGAVLNALLAAAGYEIGASELGECAETASAALLQDGCRAEVHLPEVVVVAPLGSLRPSHAHTIPITAGVPSDHAIVDFVLRPKVLSLLDSISEGRALLAGPPGLCASGFDRASGPLLELMGKPAIASLMLGGDSARELPWKGRVSSGGGSALLFLATGACPILTTLARGRTA
ncbi:MAG TPA: phosphoglycerate kinase [Solirubrobacterales bacterium]|nr:phosphoglycerate kinase [Solirubrobacterales bacterium]